MHGNKKITATVNTTLEAFFHYLMGDGTQRQNGTWAMLMFALQPEFRVLLIETYLYRKTNGGNNRAINMEFVPTQFHIGRTSYNYYVTGKMLIIGYGLDDGFRDANFFKKEQNLF